MFAKSRTEAASSRFSRVSPSGPLVWRTEFFGPSPSPRSSDSLASASALEYRDPEPGEVRFPQAFLVEQEPGATVGSHFHYVDQFQVVVAGSGKLGAHAVAPISVHFAAAHTGYGPIATGEQGLAYFTFRASADETGAQYLPRARARMRPAARRNIIAPQIVTSAPQELAGLQASRAESVLEKDDGVGVFYLRIAPGGSLDTPPAGGGLSLLVAAGAITLDGRGYGEWSCLFVEAGEGPVTLGASAGGAEVLVLRYPRKP
jgi:hypothetical protein